MRRCASPLLFCALVSAASAADAQQSIVTRCANPSGHTYYPQQLLVPKGKAGWTTDAIKDGSYLLLRRDSGKFDIVYSDSMNRTVSSLDDGAQIILVDQTESQMVFIVHYPGTNVEIWYFRIDAGGRGEVTVSQARFGEATFIQKHGLMRAACVR